MFKLRLQLFIKHIAIGLTDEFKEFKEFPDAWQRSFYKAIQDEYVDVVQDGLKHFRVSCFAESPYSMLMWSHYANCHKGFCIEYEIPPYSNSNQLFHNLHPVIYSNTRISILDQCLNSLEPFGYTQDVLWDIFKYALLMKSIDWKYQNEWRLILLKNMIPNNYNCKFFKIKKVYLGNKMSGKDRWEIIKICNSKGIPYCGVNISQEKYEMTDCTQLCENCPQIVCM